MGGAEHRASTTQKEGSHGFNSVLIHPTLVFSNKRASSQNCKGQRVERVTASSGQRLRGEWPMLTASQPWKHELWFPSTRPILMAPVEVR